MPGHFLSEEEARARVGQSLLRLEQEERLASQKRRTATEEFLKQRAKDLTSLVTVKKIESRRRIDPPWSPSDAERGLVLLSPPHSTSKPTPTP